LNLKKSGKLQQRIHPLEITLGYQLKKFPGSFPARIVPGDFNKAFGEIRCQNVGEKVLIFFLLP
jgi:hypothetical protein